MEKRSRNTLIIIIIMIHGFNASNEKVGEFAFCSFTMCV